MSRINATGGAGLKHIMSLVELVEQRIEKHKLLLPLKLDGTEDDNQRAVHFYTTAGKLDRAEKSISARGRLEALASNVNLNHTCDLELDCIIEKYYADVFNPANFTIISFHDSEGVKLNNSTVAGNSQKLKTVGDMATNNAAAARREADIAFAMVKVTIDVSSVTKDPNSKFKMDTWIELPRTSNQVKDGNGNTIDVFTFGGKEDIRTYTREEFKTEILDVTGQDKPAALQRPAFGRTECTLDESAKDEKFRDVVIKQCLPYVKNQLFKACCPGVAFRPSSALLMVKQIMKDDNGNEYRISMSLYFTNLGIACTCMGKDDYELDVVIYACDNMDPDVRRELESAHDGHLKARARDWVTQTRALNELLPVAAAAEKRVLNTRSIVSAKTTQMLLSVPGFKAHATSSSTPGFASIAEQTIGNNSPIPDFEWDKGKCIGCGSAEHVWLRNGTIKCPHAKNPGAEKNAEKNLVKLRAWLTTRKGGAGGGPSASRKDKFKPQWGRMADKAKRSFTRNLLANAEFCDEFNEHIEARKNEEDKDEESPGKKTKPNGQVNVLPTIPVMNLAPSQPPPLPVLLDGKLPHINLAVGGREQDNENTELRALVDSGAGATIGCLHFFEAACLINPMMLEGVYSCKQGEWSPITMHGIVDEAKEGVTTTVLPVAFKIKTLYHMEDGGELHMMVGLGTNVSVNFVISNAWMKKLGAVLDYGSQELRVPLMNETKKFPISYLPPARTCPAVKIDTSVRFGYSISPKQAFEQLPAMEGLLCVMSAFNSGSRLLPHARKYVKSLRSTASTKFLKQLQFRDSQQVAAPNNSEHTADKSGGSAPPEQQPPGPSDEGAIQEDNEAIKMCAEDGDDKAGDYYGPVENQLQHDGHRMGQSEANRALAKTQIGPLPSSEEEDLFASSASE